MISNREIDKAFNEENDDGVDPFQSPFQKSRIFYQSQKLNESELLKINSENPEP